MTTAQSQMDRVVAHLLARRGDIARLDPDFDLIENRVLDSLGFVEFLVLLEELTGSQLSLDEVTSEDFRTLNAIRARFFPPETGHAG